MYIYTGMADEEKACIDDHQDSKETQLMCFGHNGGPMVHCQ